MWAREAATHGMKSWLDQRNKTWFVVAHACMLNTSTVLHALPHPPSSHTVLHGTLKDMAEYTPVYTDHSLQHRDLGRYEVATCSRVAAEEQAVSKDAEMLLALDLACSVQQPFAATLRTRARG